MMLLVIKFLQCNDQVILNQCKHVEGLYLLTPRRTVRQTNMATGQYCYPSNQVV